MMDEKEMREDIQKLLLLLTALIPKDTMGEGYIHEVSKKYGFR